MPLEYSVDPLNKHGHRNAALIQELVGIIPTFINSNDPRPFKEQALENYGMATGEITGGTTNVSGCYSYPGDPDLYPLFTISRREKRAGWPDEILFIYDFAIVCFMTKNPNTGDIISTYVTRMD